MPTNKEIENQILSPLFDNKFDKNNFFNFLRELFPNIQIHDIYENNSLYLRNEYKDFVKCSHYVGSYYVTNSMNEDSLGIYVVKLKKSDSLLRARTMQRNLIGRYLEEKRFKGALVVFYDDFSDDWRLSFVKLERKLIRTKNNDLSSKTILSSAKRFSFLVGGEKNHTCKSRFLELIKEHTDPSLEEIEEVFNVETVTDEFFDQYKLLFDKLKKNLDNIIKKDKKTDSKKIYSDFEKNNIKTSDFAKKLMGQIVFIYFLQKKGWLGVKDNNWGNGDKDFFKKLYDKEYYDWENADKGNSFFNNCLEPLFYKGFSYPDEEFHMKEFGFKVPFLNGGLFSPIINYDWKNTVIDLDNKIFEEIIKIFDRFNFTVREDDPLEKEVAVDPEMLGKVFEKLLDSLERGSKGAFYTPREIVHYMCKKSISYYINTNTNIPLEDIEDFINNSDKYIERVIRYPEDVKKGSNHRLKLPDTIFNSDLNQLDDLIAKVKVADPAVGSGAFPVGMMNEIVNARHVLKLLKGEPVDIYSLKKETIKNSLYCVDIDYSATDITKLRFWLSLIVDEEKIEPLPNLGNNVVCGNSLVDSVHDIKLYNFSSRVFDSKDSNQSTLDTNNAFYKFERIKSLKNKYFDENIAMFKNKEKQEIESLKWEFIIESYESNGGDIEKIIQYENEKHRPFFLWELEFSEVFSSENPGFDIIIGNPPYVSAKGISSKDMKIYNSIYEIKDDLYNYFFLKSFHLLKSEGILCFITSDTYFALKSKLNLRKLFLDNRILELNKIGNVFKDAAVSPAIIIIKNQNIDKNYDFNFLDSKDNFDSPKIYSANTSIYKNCFNNVLFLPTDLNLQIYNKFNNQTKQVLEYWWDKIENSRKISRYKGELDDYRSKLSENQFTLLGLITEGGVGIQTANNGKFLACVEGTKYAENIKKNRPDRLFNTVIKYNIKEYDFIKSKDDAKSFLKNLSEKEIWDLFDGLKEKYGRDIFGQGYVFKIISENEIVNVNNIAANEKENGISNGPTFVLYDKGDREGNRWYSKSPYYINWSRENVSFFKSKSSKGKGYPVVRNPQFYFKEGFTWNTLLNPNAKLIKCRLKSVSIHDVMSMSMFPVMDNITAKYIVCLINSMFLFKYERTFINNTAALQLNDFKQLPIIVPSEEQLVLFEKIFDEAYEIKNKYFDGLISKETHDNELERIQIKLDEEVYILYGLSFQ